MNALAMRGSKLRCVASESRKSWVSIEEPRVRVTNEDPLVCTKSDDA
jgi:hypothetical protein